MFCALLGQNIRRAFTGPLVLWFECSNAAECPTFEIKLFTLTVHNLSIFYVISHISFEGEFGSGVLVPGHFSSFTFINSINVTLFFI